MTLEVIAAATLGALLLWLALGALGQHPDPLDDSQFDPIEDTPRGQALIALKELDFDRETGKIADDDYLDLKERLSLEAMRMLDQDPAPAASLPGQSGLAPTERPAVGPTGCPNCGPRPEPDALFCSRCGGRVGQLAA